MTLRLILIAACLQPWVGGCATLRARYEAACDGIYALGVELNRCVADECLERVEPYYRPAFDACFVEAP